jgi:hypothetical protein
VARDEYGNTINRPNRTTKAARRGAGGQLKALATRGLYTPIRTGIRQGVTNQQSQVFPEKPDSFSGSLPEWAVYWAHGAIGLREGQDFEYLSYAGGFINANGPAQFDFYEFDVQVAIEIQGIYWHYEFGGKDKTSQDAERRIRAESVGITLVYIDEDDALADPIYFLRQARAGVDRSRVTRGF